MKSITLHSMKHVLIFVLAVCTYMPASAQISTLVLKGKLLIPENPGESIRITRDELLKVGQITSKLGEIESYSIYFVCYPKGEKSLFIKNVNDNSFSSGITKNILNNEAGSEFFLDSVLIKMPKKKELISMSYKFVLTD
jgi:hypothetical protein